jgi:hypothetical protein
MCDGNPGGLTVLINLYKLSPSIDPDDAFGGLGPILSLDTLGIYGSRIWMLYKDVCDQSIPNVLTVLRAHQLGFLTDEDLNAAIDSGSKLDLQDLLKKVNGVIPDFAKNVSGT